MDESQTAGKVIIGEVGIILAQLQAAQHTLVYDVRIGQRTDVEVRIADALLDAFAYEVEDALEDRHLVVGDACDEHLFDGGLIAQCGLSQTLWVGRHVAQMHELQSLALYLLDHDGEDVLLFLFVFRQEDEACAIFAFLGDRNTLKKNKLVRNLEHDTGTVARLVVGTLSATMAHVLEYLQGIVYQLMALVAVDVNHHSYATRIVLIG